MRERFFGPEHSVLVFHRAIWFGFLKMFSGKEHRFHSCYVLLNIGHGLKRLIGPINCKWDLTAAITKIYIDGGLGSEEKTESNLIKSSKLLVGDYFGCSSHLHELLVLLLVKQFIRKCGF